MLYMCIRYCMFGFGLQLPLPDTVTERYYHSLSAIQLSPHNVLLVAFGGWRSFTGLVSSFLVELSEYVLQWSTKSHWTASSSMS